jgi:hypothetical protein
MIRTCDQVKVAGTQRPFLGFASFRDGPPQATCKLLRLEKGADSPLKTVFLSPDIYVFLSLTRLRMTHWSSASRGVVKAALRSTHSLQEGFQTLLLHDSVPPHSHFTYSF